jgi:hypothetical protein
MSEIKNNFAIKNRIESWDGKSELDLLIKNHIDTGCHRSIICNNIERDYPNKWKRHEIHKSISILAKEGLLKNFGHGYYNVAWWGDKND